MIKLLILLVSTSYGFTPVEVSSSPESVNQAMMEMALEINRTSLVNGGQINQHVKISSSVQLSSDGITFSDGTKQTTASNATVPFSVSCPTGFTEVTAQSRTLGCIQTAEEGAAGYVVALDDCFDTYGGTLPSLTEYQIAMANYTLTDETDDTEWIDEAHNAGTAIFVGPAVTTWEDSAVATSRSYRCWIPAGTMLMQ